MRKPDQTAAQSLTALVSASMQVTAQLAKSVAEAATGEVQEERSGETSLQEVVRHGSTATGSILALALSVLRQGMESRGSKVNSAKAAPLPSVIAGQKLRIPLSIDNPGSDEAMDLQPALVLLAGSNATEANKPKISFDPISLSIAPHDFEKLVVIVTTNKNAEAETWTCSFNFGDVQSGEMEFKFDVKTHEDCPVLSQT